MPVPKGNPAKLGKGLRWNLEQNIVGFKLLTEWAKGQHAKRKAMPGLDGRWIPSNSDHSALNTLLQGNGAIVMKWAQAILDADTEHGSQANGDMFWLATVHDEWQLSVDPKVAPIVAELGKQAITKAGVLLKVRCPLVGSSKIGNNWAETH